MPFGRHRGEPIDTLPTDYLYWLTENVELYGRLERAIGKELERRREQKREREGERAGQARSAAAGVNVRVDPEDWPFFTRIIESGYKALALKCHPDHHGGDGAEMRSLNRTIEKLREQLTRQHH
jgi:hypothetical protein